MSRFTIYPAIDIRGGKCVRLLQGDYEQETVYGESPLAVARSFYQEGAKWIHMVDLDGAKEGRPVHMDLILQVKKELPLKVQVGGGIRSQEDVEHYLENGVDRIILGSSAISDPAFTKQMLQQYGSRVAIGIDSRNSYVAVDGWTKTSEVHVDTLALELVENGAETFIFTDISKDGTLAGPNIKAISDLARLTEKEVIASGGVSRLDDIEMLNSRTHAGVSGVIIGKALYTKAFSLSEVLDLVES